MRVEDLFHPHNAKLIGCPAVLGLSKVPLQGNIVHSPMLAYGMHPALGVCGIQPAK